MAKILVCESRELTGRLLVEECQKDDHCALLLAREGDRDYVINNLSFVVSETMPDYMIVDHLFYRCFDAIDIARGVRPQIIPVLHTTHIELAGVAEKNGIRFYEKHKCQALDDMFFYIYETEKMKR